MRHHPRSRTTVWILTLATAGSAAMLAAGMPTSPGPARALYLTFDADMTPRMAQRAAADAASGTAPHADAAPDTPPRADAEPGLRWYDPELLDYLRQERVKATFFVTGLFAEVYPDVVRTLASDPLFEIGNHSYAHAAFAAPCYGLRLLSTDAEKLADIARAQEVLTRITGRTPTIFRYPGLCRSAHDDQLVRQSGLEIDRPTVTSGDAFNPDAEAIVREVRSRVRGGATILFHVGGPNAPATPRAVRELVPALRARGYVFETEPVRGR